MKAFWVLARLRLLDTLRSRSSTSFVLLFPVILLLVVGVVFMKGHPFERRTVVVVGDAAEGGPLAASVAVLERLDEVRLERAPTEAAALGRLRARMASAVLTASGDGVRLLVGAREELFARGLAEAIAVPVRREVIEAPRWGYVHYLFPGLFAFSIMVSGLFAMGYTMVLYRQNGFLKKLATTPLRKSSFVGAQILARGGLILVQAVILVAFARIAFGLPLGLGSALGLGLITVLGILTFMGAGFALACLIRTEDLVADIISAVNLPLVLLSEIFFPLDALPAPLAWLGGVLPSTEMVRLSRQVLLYDATSLAAVAPGLGVLALWAAGSFAVSLAVFRWHG